MSQAQRILITVKTYPTLSRTHDEVVCTAGISESGGWMRIYPVPFRKLEYEQRYKKYQWIEAQLHRNPRDRRPESRRVADPDSLRLGGHISTANKWAQRKAIILGSTPVYHDLQKAIEDAKAYRISLATFKPASIKGFKHEEAEREWPRDKLEQLAAKARQNNLFQNAEEVVRSFGVVRKLPYKFSYTFTDCRGRESTMMIEDWELGALYWKALRDCDGDEGCAVQKVRQKYLDIAENDIHLFLGTTLQFHDIAPNPFIIIGVFYPPVDNQHTLL